MHTRVFCACGVLSEANGAYFQTTTARAWRLVRGSGMGACQGSQADRSDLPPSGGESRWVQGDSTRGRNVGAEEVLPGAEVRGGGLGPTQDSSGTGCPAGSLGGPGGIWLQLPFMEDLFKARCTSFVGLSCVFLRVFCTLF